MSNVPVQPSPLPAISCSWCRATEKHADPLFSHMMADLGETDAVKQELLLGLADGRYEVAVVVPPSYENISESRLAEIKKGEAKRGFHADVFEPIAIGQHCPAELPLNAVRFWVLQIYDRFESEPQRRHSAILYCDGNVRWIKLGFTDDKRLNFKLADLKRVNPWLHDWVDAHGFFHSLTNTRKKAAKKGKSSVTSTGVFSRLLAALRGSQLGYTRVPGTGRHGGEDEAIQVDHYDENVYHSCPMNLTAMRDWANPRGVSGGGTGEANELQDSEEDHSATPIRPPFEDNPHFLAIELDYVAEQIRRAVDRGKPVSLKNVPADLRKRVLASGLLPPAYAKYL